YSQIPIDPMDQEKTTFTCPFGTYAYMRMAFSTCNVETDIQEQDKNKAANDKTKHEMEKTKSKVDQTLYKKNTRRDPPLQCDYQETCDKTLLTRCNEAGPDASSVKGAEQRDELNYEHTVTRNICWPSDRQDCELSRNTQQLTEQLSLSHFYTSLIMDALSGNGGSTLTLIKWMMRLVLDSVPTMNIQDEITVNLRGFVAHGLTLTEHLFERNLTL
ncbi:hypothetical protein Tco_1222820, partial [Tanacetum coccineum]